jgi:hypothetical protein
MSFYEFVSDNPILTYCLVWIISYTIISVFKTIFSRRKEITTTSSQKKKQKR